MHAILKANYITDVVCYLHYCIRYIFLIERYILNNTLNERLSANKRKAPDCESNANAHFDLEVSGFIQLR